MPLGYAKVEASELERPFLVHHGERPMVRGVSSIPTGLEPVRDDYRLYPLPRVQDSISILHSLQATMVFPLRRHRSGTEGTYPLEKWIVFRQEDHRMITGDRRPA